MTKLTASMNRGDFASHSTVETMAQVTTGSHPCSVTNSSACAMTYTMLTETTIEVSEINKEDIIDSYTTFIDE